MAILNVGPTKPFASIAAAMLSAGPGDTIILEAGYSNETATIAFSGMTINGDVSSSEIVLQLATGIAVFTTTGTAPFRILDALDS
jgi:hypothetical protein